MPKVEKCPELPRSTVLSFRKNTKYDAIYSKFKLMDILRPLLT